MIKFGNTKMLKIKNIKFEPKLFKKIRSQAIDYTLMKIPENSNV